MIEKLYSIVGKENVFLNEPMKNHTTFKVGGPVDFFIIPKSSSEISGVVSLLNENFIPFYIIGNGSNILVGDKGIRGAVIKITSNMNTIFLNDNTITAYSGALLSKVGNFAFDNSLTGFEFASGIPGTIGGAVYMNAGAYGGEFKNIVKSVTFLDESNTLKTISGSDCNFGYRTSYFSKHKSIVICCEIKLSNGNKTEIKEIMEDLKLRRISKQPLEKPSAGSTFKRPEGYFAGALIEECNLKGYSVGGAMVSTKHAGFIINENNASASDILNLINHVIMTVQNKHGVTLQPEVKLLGEF